MKTENFVIDPALKRAQVAITLVSMIYNRANHFIELGEDALAKFTRDLNGEHPAYAFEWSHNVMQSTALMDASKYIKRAMDNTTSGTNPIIWALRDEMQSMVSSKARRPSFSTSPTSNLMNQFTASACAEWLAILNQAVITLEAYGLKVSPEKSTTDEA